MGSQVRKSLYAGSGAAGTQVGGFSGDGGPATQARLNAPFGLGVGPEGSVYINDTGNHRIRRVAPDGTITTIAGTDDAVFTGDGGPGPSESVNPLDGNLAVGPDLQVYIPDYTYNRVRGIGPFLPGLATGDFLVPAKDGSEIYAFSGGRLAQTLDGLTAAVRYTFAYDTDGRLVSITDGDANVTTIEHDGAGNPTAIVGPYGHRTTLSVNGNGYLQSITNPAAEAVGLTSNAGGLLIAMTDPRGGPHAFTYDGLGFLVADQDAAGGVHTLTRTILGPRAGNARRL